MTKTEIYSLLLAQLSGLLDMETDSVANMANLSAAIYHTLPDLNWAGFYKLRGMQLVLGPFQGLPACVRIDMGKGVCGTAAQTGKTQVVPNVHEFAGHIACDGASNSEIVVPIFKQGVLWGVLDLDSPLLSRFDATDKLYLEKVARLFEEETDL